MFKNVQAKTYFGSIRNLSSQIFVDRKIEIGVYVRAERVGKRWDQAGTESISNYEKSIIYDWRWQKADQCDATKQKWEIIAWLINIILGQNFEQFDAWKRSRCPQKRQHFHQGHKFSAKYWYLHEFYQQFFTSWKITSKFM